MISDIIYGIIITILSGIIIGICTKLYNGTKHFGGIRNKFRLFKDCYNAGIVNIFPDRKTYIQHKDHGKSYEYISRATHSVLYVGYWLATATEIGELTDTVKKLIDKQITVTLVFISPEDETSLNICSNYIATKPNQISSRVKTAIKNLLEFKDALDADQRRYLILKTHTIPLSTTAFIIDHSKADDCRILLDYKMYQGNRESSYGIEFRNSKKTMTNKILQSYLSISKHAVEINSYEDLRNYE